jgi:hypothetical protein
MELLLFIYALECGIMGDVEMESGDIYTNNPALYAQAEIGVRLNDAFFIVTANAEGVPDELDGLDISVRLFVDYEGYGFGIEYDYALFTLEKEVTIYGRFQSWQ